MLPSLGIVTAALLLSGVQAAVPRLVPRGPSNETTTTTSIAESTFSTPIFSLPADTTDSTTELPATTSTTDFPESTVDSTPTFGSNGGITISGVVTMPSASLPTSFQTTGTGAFGDIGAAATNAGNSFLDVASAASSIAANPSPSAEELQAFQNQAQDEFEQLSNIEAQLKQIDQNSLSEDDSHKTEAAIAGLAALLAFYSTQLAAIAPVIATPALAAGVFAEVAPALAAAAAGELLSKALDELKELDQDGDDGDDNDDDDDDDSTSTENSTSATSTETSTTTSATSSCSALPYTLELPEDPDDDDSGDDLKRSIAGRVQLDGRGLLEKRGKRPAYFAGCTPAKKLTFPNNPNAEALVEAEAKPKAGTNKNYNEFVVKWYDRKISCEDLSPGWEKIETAKAQERGLDKFTVDHIWELKFFTDYFESFLPVKGPDPTKPAPPEDQPAKHGPAQITCEEFDEIFRKPECILTKVVGSVPSPDNPEFVALRSNLNKAKGAMFKPGGLNDNFFTREWKGNLATEIQVLQDLGITVAVFNQPQVVALFEKTNQRMYNTLQGIDNRVRDNSITVQNTNFNFANTYESFMASRLAQSADQAWKFVQEWMATVEAKLATMDPESEETQRLQKNFDGFKNSPYASQGHYSFAVNTDLANGGGAPVQFKRDLWARDGSCALEQPETTTADESTTEVTLTTTTPGFSTTTAEPTTEEATTTPTTLSTTTVSSQSTTEQTTTSVPTTSEAVPTTSQAPIPNPDGTNVHVNAGCILINGSPRCASDAGNIASVYESSYNVASDPNQSEGTTLILSGFDSGNDNHLHSTPTCQLQARWPANYGDVYFGADGCLYDSGSNKIFDQCCSTPDSNNSGLTTNPFVAPAPPDTSQSFGDHDGSSICRSFGKDTCLAAASRYVDDIVYHQYTSAVWPDSTGADIANEIFPVVGPFIEDLFGINYGCTVIWTCDDDDAFSQGMTGKQIKDQMLNIYNLNGAKGCGSTYLNNRCHVTVNGCNNCRDEGRDGTIWNPYDVYSGTYGDANDGFPPRR